MLEPTNSVYLDPPRSSRVAPAAKGAHSGRAAAAGIFIFVGLLGLTVAALLSGIRAMLHDSKALSDAIDTTLDEPVVQEEIEREVADAIVKGLFDQDNNGLASVVGFDVSAEVERLAPLVIADPAFRSELRALFIDGHQRILFEPSRAALDFSPITAAVLGVIERESPELARIVPADKLLLTIDGDRLPDLTTPMAGLDRSLLIAFVFSLAIPLAALTHPRRHRVLAWVGRWLITTSLAGGLAAVGLPYLAGNLSGYTAVEVAVRALTVRLLGPAVLAGIVGMAMVSAAAVLKSRERRRITDEGAAAALGVNEPPLSPAQASPQLELSQRGLVDAGRPLTDI